MLRVLLLTLLSLGAVGCATSTGDQPYRAAAIRTADWLRSVEQPTDDGKTWPVEPDKADTSSASLYAGAPGVVLFFLEAQAATDDRSYLADAQAGADELLAQLPETMPRDGAGLYTGVAGVGFALAETYRATGNGRYRDGALQVVELLRANARQVGAGVEWNDSTDIISGGAGIGLFLLYAARELEIPAARELAIAVGRRLVELAQPSDAGLRWAMSPNYPRRMPNFSHGTAGIAYFLATLSQHTDEESFRDAAVDGARYLLSIANTDDGGCLICHHEPDGEDLYYLGWCHGPVGTARLFHRLAEVTGDAQWMTWVRRSARSVMESGIPEMRTPGLWDNVGQCCGTAGVGQFFLDLHRATGEREYLVFSKQLAADMRARATESATGLKWIQAEHRVRPELLAAQTGYMQGAAGIGMFLLQLDAFEHGRRPTIVWPDSPFGN